MLKLFDSLFIRTPLHSLTKAFPVAPGKDSLFAEGVYLSSSELWHQWQKYDQLTAKEKEKVDISLAKYWLRSCTRCTPYATFAGMSTVSLNAASTQLVISDEKFHHRAVRPDMNFLSVLTASLHYPGNAASSVLYHPNNSMYEIKDETRFVEYFIRDKKRFYELNAVQQSPYTTELIEFAARGKPFYEIVRHCMQVFDATAEEADSFTNELIKSQLLVPESGPFITSADPFGNAIEVVDKSGNKDLAEKLSAIHSRQNNPATGVNGLKEITESLASLQKNGENEKNILQVDLVPSFCKAEIAAEVIRKILSQVEELSVLSATASLPAMENFIKNFRKKFDDAIVPLCVALDVDRGVGYGDSTDESSGGSSLINDLDIQSVKNTNDHGLSKGARPFVFDLYTRWVREGGSCITITGKDLDKNNLEKRAGIVPGSYYLCGSLLRNATPGKNEYDFYVAGIGGPSGANLAARFANASKQVEELVRKIIQSEEKDDPHALYAEIVHVPQNRVGNIIARPVLRSFEIPYAGQSGTEPERQIRVSDLYIQLVNDEPVLISRRLGKRIIPRLSSAHNFEMESLPVYRFLCHLQQWGKPSFVFWNWDGLNDQPYLPRVVYKNIILKRASWLLREEELTFLVKHNICADTNTALLQLVSEKGIPQRVLYTEGDHELLLDFKQPVCIKIVLHYLRQKRELRVEEFLFNKDNCVVLDAQGQPYTNELIIPFEKTNNNPVSVPAVKPFPEETKKRVFVPGSEWLYAKIYCGSRSAEQLLQHTIPAFINEELTHNGFEKFFFTRYKDDFHHLRLRFYNSNTALQPGLQQRLLGSLKEPLESGSIHRITYDTYTREMERYGIAVIEETESLFYYDSMAVLGFIAQEEGSDSAIQKLFFAIRAMDQLMSDFLMSPESKRSLMKNLADAFLLETGNAQAVQQQLNNKFRYHQQLLVSYLTDHKMPDHWTDPLELLTDRSNFSRPVAARILQKQESGQIASMLSGLIHMFMNKLFTSMPRRYEMVAYLFAERYYSSLLAKQRAAQVPAVLTDND